MRKKPLAKILYVAPAETVPGKVGGSVHVEEVARGLAGLGYRVDVLCRRAKGFNSREELAPNLRIHRLVPKYKIRYSLWRAKRYAYRLAKEYKPDYIIERYYNFGGAGVLAGRKFGVPVMLEVNSPVIDHPGSLKALIDRLLIFKPMKRYRVFMCRSAADIITPLPEIIPWWVPEEKIHKVNWGAAVERFHKNPVRDYYRKNLGLSLDRTIVIFLGSFRKWHGVWDLAEAAKEAIQKHPKLFFLMIGDGEERKPLQRWISKHGMKDHFRFTGSVEYRLIPDYLAAADIGTAPYNPALHPQLKLGFYWSPLKIFEYMAASLPVITIDVAPLNDIIRHGKDGILYPAGDVNRLSECITEIAKMPLKKREEMGAGARERVTKNYSWSVHCRELDRIIRERIGIK